MFEDSKDNVETLHDVIVDAVNVTEFNKPATAKLESTIIELFKDIGP